METMNIQLDGGVLCIEINRAGKRNAIDMPMFDVMARELRRAGEDPAVNAVLLCGAGDGFTAGHDLKAFEEWPQAAADPVPRFLHALAALRKPLVIAVQGWGMGIGATALLHADWVCATPDAKLRFPFLDLGIAPEAGSSLLLARAVGSLRARQLLLAAVPLGARQALDWGLVSELCEADALRATALERARELGAKPPELFRGVKDWLAPVAEVHVRIDEEIKAINQAVVARRGKGAA